MGSGITFLNIPGFHFTRSETSSCMNLRFFLDSRVSSTSTDFSIEKSGTAGPIPESADRLSIRYECQFSYTNRESISDLSLPAHQVLFGTWWTVRNWRAMATLSIYDRIEGITTLLLSFMDRSHCDDRACARSSSSTAL